MHGILIFIYGLIAYAAFFVTILYAMGFMANFWVPKSVDSGQAGSVGMAIAANVSLLAVFAIQHTIMARPAFKEWWSRIIPRSAERSTFVLVASLLLGLLFWQWRAMPGTLWHSDYQAVRCTLWGVSLLGWATVFYSSFLIDHFDLFGLRQAWFALNKLEYTPRPFILRSLYKWVRHPLMLGFLIAFWATPDMTHGHLLFALVTTAYILFGVSLEERDLIKVHGEDYLRYRQTTPMLLPFTKRGPKKAPVQQPDS